MDKIRNNKITLNFVYSLGYNLINVLAPFIITPYVARVLGADNLGIYSYSNSVAYYFVIFAMLGVSNYGNRTIASVRDNKAKMSKVFWDIYYLQMALSFITSSIYLLYCIFLSTNTVVSLTLIFYVISAGFDITWFFYGIENFKFVLIRNFIIKLINLIFVFLFVKSQADLFLYTLIMSIGFLLANWFMWTNVKKYISFFKPHFKDSIVHLKPNLVLFIPVIAISFYNFMDKIMLGNLSDMTQVGYYDNSEKIMTIPQTIVTSLGAVMLPRISNMLANGKNNAVAEYLKKSIIFVAFISSACTFGIITVANEFVKLYLGEEYTSCVNLLYFLMPCLIFKAYANVFRMQYIIPQKKDRIYISSVCLGAILNFSFNFILIPKYQATGACIGTIIAEIIVCLYQMFFVLREQKIGLSIFAGFGFQFCGLGMFFCVNRVDFSGKIIMLFSKKILLGGTIYLILSGLYFLLLLKLFRRKKCE